MSRSVTDWDSVILKGGKGLKESYTRPLPTATANWKLWITSLALGDPVVRKIPKAKPVRVARICISFPVVL